MTKSKMKSIPDTHYAKPRRSLPGCPNAYAMISISVSPCASIFIASFKGQCREPMMCADRSTLASRAILFFFTLVGIPGASRCATLEDSAVELSHKIAAVLPSGQKVSWEIRNNSSLRPDEIARIDQALKAQLQDQGVQMSASGTAETSVKVTLSENWKELIWTGEIRQGDALHTVLLVVPRSSEYQAHSNSMHVTIRSEKFWEGAERILDAAEVSNGNGKSWFVMLKPASLIIQDLQTGSTSKIDIASSQSTSRDSWGQLGSDQSANVVWFAIMPQVCKVDLETSSLTECLPDGAASEGPTSTRLPFIIDLAPTTSSSPGKGLELVIAPVCGGTNQFLATGARDYTQTDSLQVLQTEPNGPVAMSGELDFPGPIVALHTALDAPRAIVRNLTTGYYEAYRLAISCGQ